MNLRYEQLNQNNLKTIARIQYEIFPTASYYKGYINCLNKRAKQELPKQYLVYWNDKPIGITGLYCNEKYPDTIWLSWFGVLKEYRGKGFGTKILLDSIELAKKYNKKWFRLYTYEVWNKEAQPLYNKVMQIGEYYRNEKEPIEKIEIGKCKIFGYSLCDEKIQRWNDKFINLTITGYNEKETLKMLKEDNII